MLAALDDDARASRRLSCRLELTRCCTGGGRGAELANAVRGKRRDRAEISFVRAHVRRQRRYAESSTPIGARA